MDLIYYLPLALINETGITGISAELAAHAVAMALVALLALIAHLITRRWLLTTVRRLVEHSRTQWDDKMVEHRVFFRLSHLVPALVVYFLADGALAELPQWQFAVGGLTQIYMIMVGFFTGNALLDSAVDIFQETDKSHSFPIRGFVQAIKLVIFMATGIFVLSVLLDKSPSVLIGSLGALTAIIMLVFKDSILGFVAGIHLSANRMVAKGDWVELPSYNADGEVIDITLSTVKVQNWDRTVTAVPTYALISNSFKNWQAMFAAGGRRIKRAVYLDIDSVTFCDPAMADRFERIGLIETYVRTKRREMRTFNREHGVDDGDGINGKQITNIGTFRAYLEAYLRHHPMIRQDMTLLVRQLPPSEHGLPIEIYAFCKDTRWAAYEGYMADIFDHIYAVLPEFGLRAYQRPSGHNLTAALDGIRAATGPDS